ncbi:MAG: hypothetical protein ACXIUL_08345 [Wenzhouxiangella sp.]
MSDLDTIRRLLKAGHEEELDALRERFDALDLELPAFFEKAQNGPESRALLRALSPLVGNALGDAIRRDRQTIADALAPAIGPSIRKSISDALRGLINDINQVVEQRFSLRSLGWRWEAMRTGVPFAQIALKNSLRYRIDHVLLIDAESGQLLFARSAPSLEALDRDAVAGMLSAITDFVLDTMRGSSRQVSGLASATVGEHLVQVLEGEQLRLALFIQGVPSSQAIDQAWECLEAIEASARNRAELDEAGWQMLGDVNLSTLPLQGAVEQDEAAPTGAGRWLVWTLMSLLLLAWLVHCLHERAAVKQERVAITRAVQQTPGWALNALDLDKGWRLTVLRDPDSRSVDDFSAALEIAPRRGLTMDEVAMLSLDPSVVTRRAQRLLAPPEGAALELSADGTLVVSGQAEAHWRNELDQAAARVVGVERVDVSGMRWLHDPAELERIEDLVQQIEAMFIELPRGGAAFTKDHNDPFEKLSRLSADLAERAAGLGGSFRLRVIGWSDASGSADMNVQLRFSRSAAAVAMLSTLGVDTAMLRIDPQGRVGPLPGVSFVPELELPADGKEEVQSLPAG